VTGFGVAGTFAGSYIIIGISAPPEKRPAMTGFMGSAYAIASVIGPCKISLSNFGFKLFPAVVL
jgi:MFS family permease